MENKVALVLKRAYKKKKLENRRFSMQLIANRLGISLPFVSQVLNGHRALPAQLADQMCRILDLDLEQRDFVLRSVLESRKIKAGTDTLVHLDGKPKTEKKTSGSWQTPPRDLFWVLRDWHYLAILDTTLLAAYDGTPAFLAERLSLSLEKAQTAQEKLLQAGLLEMVDGIPRKSARYNYFMSLSQKEEIRRYHQESLDKAKETLRDLTAESDLEKRLITTYTTTASRAKIQWAKQQISDFIASLTEELSDGEAEEVYQLSIQLFPLTHPVKK